MTLYDIVKIVKLYKFVRSIIDGTEYKFGKQHFTLEELPDRHDLRTTGYIPPILNQGSLGSCASNVISNSLRYCLQKQHKIKNTQNNTEESTQDNEDNTGDVIWQPSRLFIYYFARIIEGSPVTEDTGISIKGGLQTIKKYGVCDEKDWPYNIKNFATKPPPHLILSAKLHSKNYIYYLVPQDLYVIKQALLIAPIIIGAHIYESFESDTTLKSGIVHLPDKSKERYFGGHALSIVSWDDASLRFGIANSWGTEVGMDGYFSIPYQYILDPNLVIELWTCHTFQ
jgi:C1A family cysteine protease